MSRWLPFVLLTVLSWGTYIPTLHKGQVALNGSGLHAFLMVGVAYLLVAIAVPGVIIARAGSWGVFTSDGVWFHDRGRCPRRGGGVGNRACPGQRWSPERGATGSCLRVRRWSASSWPRCITHRSRVHPRSSTPAS